MSIIHRLDLTYLNKNRRRNMSERRRVVNLNEEEVTTISFTQSTFPYRRPGNVIDHETVLEK